MKIILDTNIWISFLLGKKLAILSEILKNDEIQIYSSKQLLREIMEVAKRPKFHNKISIQSIDYLFKLINVKCKYIDDNSPVSISVRDKKDIFILSMAQNVYPDYIITGDKDLLVIKKYNNTEIITFNEFIKILNL